MRREIYRTTAEVFPEVRLRLQMVYFGNRPAFKQGAVHHSCW
jgi:hypothetical protein